MNRVQGGKTNERPQPRKIRIEIWSKWEEFLQSETEQFFVSNVPSFGRFWSEELNIVHYTQKTKIVETFTKVMAEAEKINAAPNLT